MKATALALAGLVFFAAPFARGEEDASLPTPSLVFSVTPGTGGGLWKLRIENTGELPLRVAADPRLLVLEVTPPAGTVVTPPPKRAPAVKKPAEPVTVRCELPGDVRPAADDGSELVIPAKRAWSASIDPLLYCFGARERASLVAGATVKARFGWPAPPSKTPAVAARARKKAPMGSPFVAAPVGASIGKVAPAKDLEATPFAVAEGALAAATPAAPATPAENAPGPGRPALSVSMPEAMDVARGFEIGATVTILNEGDKAAVLLFRPETVHFSVAGPQGSVACGATREVDSPMRELYATLGPKARSSVTLLLTAKCPADTFDAPGIYRVTAILDTSGASGRGIGLKSWDGQATAKAPMLLRVRAARRPNQSTSRPALD